jgi:hypothetical protein
MKASAKVSLATAAGAAVLALTSAGASAAIACSGNTCWHVGHRYHYPASAHVVIHEDNWHRGPKVVIREHEGRGYWHGSRWVAW